MWKRRAAQCCVKAHVSCQLLDDVVLYSNRVVRLLQPSSELVIKITLGPNVDELASPSWSVVRGLHDPRMAKPAPQREADSEPGLAGIQAREPNTGDANEPRLLRNHLHVAK